ncbi:CidA/LrgA family protein [Guptibacillus hwajinpoensis]|uniref:CidA/LrgA family protein n=1 Tax=Guptibacillus hwajinpoensis TaxID=208199 RepID=UPI001CFDC902|nr:CidA/LrgA family protein [Pseudalkalibacillus hwajinpoensis]
MSSQLNKYMIITLQIVLLFGFYLVGGFLQTTFALPVPGSVVGMLLLLIGLYLKWIPIQWISKGSSALLNHLPLLFVPVTVGIMQHLDFFSGKSLWLVPIVLFSTWIVMGITGLLGQFLANRKEWGK